MSMPIIEIFLNSCYSTSASAREFEQVFLKSHLSRTPSERANSSWQRRAALRSLVFGESSARSIGPLCRSRFRSWVFLTSI